MTAPSAASRDFTSDALPPSVEETAVPVPLRLQAWHRPRKQFIREHQWLEAASRLIDKEKGNPGLPTPAGGSPQVDYLTLPGTDYLDVRLLGEVCQQKGCLLKSTGFLAAPASNPYMARARLREQELVETGLIAQESQLYPYKFEEITAIDGLRYKLIEERGPFHIVNIDACGSVATPSAQHSNRLVDAIYRIVEFQLARKAGSWLLFVTVDARPESLNEETLNKLYQAVSLNARTSAAFESRLSAMMGARAAPVETALRSVQNPGSRFLKIFALSLTKWLLHLADRVGWDTNTHPAYCYSTTPPADKTPTMACLALEFSPRREGLQDPFEVTRANPAPSIAIKDTSIRAISQIEAMEDLDATLQASPPLYEQMARRTADLLKEAGYPDSVLAELRAPVPA